MYRTVLIAAAFSTVLSACQTTTSDTGSSAAVGAVFGAITATALGANTEWLIIGTLAGAAAGAIVAENKRTGECAYSNGDGTYYRAPCR